MTPPVFAVSGTSGTGVSTVALALVWHQIFPANLLVLPTDNDWPAATLTALSSRLTGPATKPPPPLSTVLQSRACALLNHSTDAQQAVDWQFQDLPQTISIPALQSDGSPAGQAHLTGNEPDWLCLGNDFDHVLTNPHTPETSACFQFGFRRLIAHYEALIWDSPSTAALSLMETAYSEKAQAQNLSKHRHSSQMHRHDGVLTGKAKGLKVQPIWVVGPGTDWNAFSPIYSITEAFTTPSGPMTQQPAVVLNQWPDESPLPEVLAEWLRQEICRLVARLPHLTMSTLDENPLSTLSEAARIVAAPYGANAYCPSYRG